ncbi:Clp protease N-terminal domain-containing protein [Sciscionella marina]|uniref:Clp protease N-terminal domain-containing protein n=1 Tax=Sciscionella marina TaxID=508770 RepID=UPI00037165AE|nr:Clp protease N-terminal domain-containing protein [Sciscionella marina]
MFERFTDSARRAVVLAQEQAREMHSGEIDSAHLLLGLTVDRRLPASGVLADAGVTPELLRARAVRGDAELDAEALAALGIDVDEVRSRVEEEFGAGALDKPPKRWSRGHNSFTKAAKKSLECALREAVHNDDKRIEDLHVLLGIVRADPQAVERLCGLDPDSLRAAAKAELGKWAA